MVSEHCYVGGVIIWLVCRVNGFEEVGFEAHHMGSQLA